MVYEYLCKCGKKFEKNFSLKENSSETLCTCGLKAKKVPSLSSFHLKGGGWASENYSKSSGAKK